MSENEEKIEALEKKVDSLQKQTIWTFGGCAVFLALFNSYLLVQSPKFAKIFDDLLDGAPLPGITEVFIGKGSLIMTGTVVVPLLVILFSWKVRSYTFAVLGALIFSLFVELALIISALIFPILHLINSLE